jgi:hypothetical protein
MVWLFFLVLGPVLAGVVLAFVWWLVRGRKTDLPSARVRALFLAAGLLLVFGEVALRLMSIAPLSSFDMPSEFWDWFRDYRFAAPLLAGILGMGLLAFPIRNRSGLGAADLAPRTPLSFASRSWLISLSLVLGLILIVTVAAGAASQPDPVTGRYTMYFVELGGERAMGTSIYGWFSSTPSLILLGVLVAVAVLVLFLIARPALGRNQMRDVDTRTIRTRNVLAVATGALLIHLGLVLGSLAGTASVRSWFSTSEGNVTFWTTFAALEPVLAGASHVAAAIGVAIWLTVALSAIPTRRHDPAAIRS